MILSDAPLTGRKTVGTTEVQVTSTTQVANYGLQIISDPSNSGLIFVGVKGVTPDSD